MLWEHSQRANPKVEHATVWRMAIANPNGILNSEHGDHSLPTSEKLVRHTHRTYRIWPKSGCMISIDSQSSLAGLAFVRKKDPETYR
jgi:hypothetical protein